MKIKLCVISVLLLISMNVQAGRYITQEELANAYIKDWAKYQQFTRVVWNYARRTGTRDWNNIKAFLINGDARIKRPVGRPEIAEVLGQVVQAVLASAFDSPNESDVTVIWGEVELPGIGNIGITGLDEWYLFFDGNVDGLEQTIFILPPKPGDRVVFVGK